MPTDVTGSTTASASDLIKSRVCITLERRKAMSKDYHCKDCCHWKKIPTWISEKGLCVLRSDYVKVVTVHTNDNVCEHFKLKSNE